MKKLIVKSIIYSVLILLALELMVRAFHLYQQYPPYIIDDKNVEVNAPNQNGYYVTGNRRMNFAEYYINKSGFNSYREFEPTADGIEVALIGDSFIEGFHQNYYNSTGRKIENLLEEKVQVYEYGYSGYDFADQVHLISAYKEQFELIDHVIIYLKFYMDLERGTYEPNHYRVDLQNSLSFRLQDNIKLIAYAKGIGVLRPFRNLKDRILGTQRVHREYIDDHASEEDTKKYLDNFKTLVKTYNIDKTKTTFLLDGKKTSPLFLDYCNSNGYKYVDYGPTLDNSKTPTTLIYDQHWNNHGRNLIAEVLAKYIRNHLSIQ
ncbi:hypothetical protein [Seonamhaeicola sp.]|uniref:hypothetical protein n=1 Tax=Seonamhaeicola sp. TaxID=1912245 RepID=UPI00260BC608|nr:hypothetical protein [Seonamhaeicola sp.]